MNAPVTTNPVISPLVQGHLDTGNDVFVDKNPAHPCEKNPILALVQGYLGTEDEVVVKTSLDDIQKEHVPSPETKKPSKSKGPPKDYVELLRRRKRELEQVLHSSPLPAVKSQPKGLSRLLGPKDEDEDEDNDGGVSFANFSKASRQYDVHIVSDMSDISCSEFELDAEDDIDQDQRRGLQEIETDSAGMAPQTMQQYFPAWQSAETDINDASPQPPNKRPLPRIDSMGLSNETCDTQSSDGIVSSDKALALTSKSSNSSGLSFTENDIECAIPNNSSTSKNVLEVALRKQPSMSFLATDNTTLTADSTATAALRMKRSLIWMVACLSLLVVILVITVSVVTIVALRNRDQHFNNPTNSSLHPPPAVIVTSLRPTTPPATLRHNIFVPSPPAPVSPPSTRRLMTGPVSPSQTLSSAIEKNTATLKQKLQ